MPTSRDTGFFFPFVICNQCSSVMPTFLPQSISCHFASSEGYYIDVKDTIQEDLEKELQEMVQKKYSLPAMKLRVRLRCVPCYNPVQFPFLRTPCMAALWFCYSQLHSKAMPSLAK